MWKNGSIQNKPSYFTSPELISRPQQLYTSSKLIRTSNAVSILWFIFTICSVILITIIFVRPEWIGNESKSTVVNPGHFGLWRFCTQLALSQGTAELNHKETCIGRLDDFSSTSFPYEFRIATVFIGLAVIGVSMSVLALLLFCLEQKISFIFEICGSLQFFSAFCLAVGIVTFPAGWYDEEVKAICGKAAAQYSLGNCEFKWVFVLALICFMDLFILAMLAFTLANVSRQGTQYLDQLNNQNQELYMNQTSLMNKGEINNGFVYDNQSIAGSRKSLNIQPVYLMPPPLPTFPDNASELSQIQPHPATSYRATIQHQNNNFQL